MDQNNRCHKNAGKFRRNIVSSEISSKSHEKPGILTKFVCITFAQYCSWLLLLSKRFAENETIEVSTVESVPVATPILMSEPS